jgi:hypothetical protein
MPCYFYLIDSSSGIDVVEIDVDVVTQHGLLDGEAVAADDLGSGSPEKLGLFRCHQKTL